MPNTGELLLKTATRLASFSTLHYLYNFTEPFNRRMTKIKVQRTIKVKSIYFDRDLSWLSFNERVLTEAQHASVPLMERIRFLSIFSSNLDEFYRVRMPALMALKRFSEEDMKKTKGILSKVNKTIRTQQQLFGDIIENQILPDLKRNNFHLIYNETLPEAIIEPLKYYFLHAVTTYIQIVDVSRESQFFPENNKLYLAVATALNENKRLYIVNIPSDVLSRFYSFSLDGKHYIIFLDDIIKLNLSIVFPGQQILSSSSLKVTRDAELDLQDEFTGNLAKKIEKRIHHRDLGLATRFLHEPGMSKKTLKLLSNNLRLRSANIIQGGRYHNLKDLANLPLKDPRFNYEPWPHSNYGLKQDSIYEAIVHNDILVHPPYNSYDTVLRFFNEASIDPTVEKIYVTLYRVANDSRIVNALISAAKNGKKIIVFVELKARFDEANNIKWSKRMKASGIQIIESIPGLKVHAKLALIKRNGKKGQRLCGIIATGNFNENTARYYTDHILLTAHNEILEEVERIFLILKRRRNVNREKQGFSHLLVGQFNLQQRFIELIDREIKHAREGLSASITIKLNNLEDKVLISKLYEASRSGVKIFLIVRSICCLVPGVPDQSENITVKRIIDRYLEHGRVFIFKNNNDPKVYIGSADWMNRNIYRRIEVCVPILSPRLKSELINIINIQVADNAQAVTLDAECNNIAFRNENHVNHVRSQHAISNLVAQIDTIQL